LIYNGSSKISAKANESLGMLGATAAAGEGTADENMTAITPRNSELKIAFDIAISAVAMGGILALGLVYFMFFMRNGIIVGDPPQASVPERIVIPERPQPPKLQTDAAVEKPPQPTIEKTGTIAERPQQPQQAQKPPKEEKDILADVLLSAPPKAKKNVIVGVTIEKPEPSKAQQTSIIIVEKPELTKVRPSNAKTRHSKPPPHEEPPQTPPILAEKR
jgi:hypothetical protein